MPEVPRDWAALTPAWLGAALGRPVASVSIDRQADGTNARARVTVRWADADGTALLFVKREGRLLHRLALTALGAREAEPQLARSGLVLPLEHPAFLAGAVDRRRLAAIVVMEDVTARGGRPNSLTVPLTADQVADGLRQLAALHEAYWERPLPAFVRPWRVGPQWAPVARGGIALARRRLRRLGFAAAFDPGEVERRFRAWAGEARRGPQTLLHGDPHPGNSYGIGAGIGFYDWQLVRSGSWVHDVGYFLVSSLMPDDRRTHERDLLAGYLDRLGRRPDDAWERYARAPAYGLGAWLQTIAAGSFQPVDTCLAAIERFEAAYRDLRRGS